MPADEAKKTQEEINKNIVRITKLLEMHGRNPAEVKAQKKEEQDLIKQEKLLQEKWVGVLDEQKKEMGKSRVKISSMTSFIGLEAKKYFAETEKNQVTWGGLAKSIKTGVKDWFEAASKQNTMLGRTLRLGASLWKGVNDHIIGTVKNVFGTIAGQMREVLGELAGVFDFIKGIFMGLFNFVKDAFLGFFKRVPPQDRKRNQLLQKIVDYMRRAEKRDMLEFMVPDESIQGLLLPLAMIAAALVGGMVRRFLMPFEAIWNIFKIGARLKQLKDFVRGLFVMPKWVFKIKWTVIKWWRALGGLLGKSGIIVKFGTVLGKLGAALKFGFKFLGWPLTIILGVIDFIKGFIATEGNLADKITGGVKGAIMGFLELPIRFFGWLVEKILGIFGVEVDGIADKILGFIRGFIDIWVGMFRPIIGAVEGLFTGGITGMIKGFFGGIGDFFKILQPIAEKLEPLREAIIGFFDAAWEWIKGLWDWWPFGDDEEEEGGVPKPKPDISPVSTVSQAQANAKKAEQDSQTGKVVDAINQQTEKTMEQNEKLSKDTADNLAVAMATSGDDSKPGGEGDKQLKDEVEIYGLLAGNSNMV